MVSLCAKRCRIYSWEKFLSFQNGKQCGIPVIRLSTPRGMASQHLFLIVRICWEEGDELVPQWNAWKYIRSWNQLFNIHVDVLSIVTNASVLDSTYVRIPRMWSSFPPYHGIFLTGHVKRGHGNFLRLTLCTCKQKMIIHCRLIYLLWSIDCQPLD